MRRLIEYAWCLALLPWLTFVMLAWCVVAPWVEARGWVS